MSITIEFRDRPRIALEVVFDEDVMPRNIANAFRFALKSYLYNKDRALYEFSVHSGIPSNTVSRQLGCGKSVNKLINYKTAEAACDYFKVDFLFLYTIAEQFVKNPEYNAISFSDNGAVIFLKGFKFLYSD